MGAEDWDHFLYVGKIAFVGWTLHYGGFNCLFYDRR